MTVQFCGSLVECGTRNTGRPARCLKESCRPTRASTPKRIGRNPDGMAGCIGGNSTSWPLHRACGSRSRLSSRPPMPPLTKKLRPSLAGCPENCTTCWPMSTTSTQYRRQFLLEPPVQHDVCVTDHALDPRPPIRRMKQCRRLCRSLSYVLVWLPRGVSFCLPTAAGVRHRLKRSGLVLSRHSEPQLFPYLIGPPNQLFLRRLRGRSPQRDRTSACAAPFSSHTNSVRVAMSLHCRARRARWSRH